MEANKNFDKECHSYYNEDTQEWIPIYEIGEVEQWGNMTNKEIKAINEIEQPTLF